MPTACQGKINWIFNFDHIRVNYNHRSSRIYATTSDYTLPCSTACWTFNLLLKLCSNNKNSECTVYHKTLLACTKCTPLPNLRRFVQIFTLIYHKTFPLNALVHKYTDLNCQEETKTNTVNFAPSIGQKAAMSISRVWRRTHKTALASCWFGPSGLTIYTVLNETLMLWNFSPLQQGFWLRDFSLPKIFTINTPFGV